MPLQKKTLMNGKIFGGDQLHYQLKRSKRARRLRLSVHCDGNVVVTVPWCYSFNCAHSFVKEKTEWILKKIDYFQSKDVGLWKSDKADYLKYKVIALDLVKARVNHFNQHYSYLYNTISIRDTKTRWASCSQNGNLHFSYKLIFLPEEFRDYIVVHELCHLREFNHSARFWALVEETVPNYKEIRKQIRKM